jgi:hypothetical protein
VSKQRIQRENVGYNYACDAAGDLDMSTTRRDSFDDSAAEEVEDDWSDNELVAEIAPEKKLDVLDSFKRPGHVLGASFWEEFAGKEVSSIGMVERDSCKVMAAILKGLQSNKDVTMSTATKALQTALLSGEFPDNASDTVIERLKKGIPIILPTRFEKRASSECKEAPHSVGLYVQLIDNQLIILHCNKGAGINESKDFHGESGVLMYVGKPTSNAYKELGAFFYKKSASTAFYREFEKFLKDNQFKLYGFIPLQKQKIGTCAIVNKIGLVAGLEAYQDKIKTPAEWESSDAKKRFKDFTTACRKQEVCLLIDKIDTDAPLQGQRGYKMLIDFIERKAEKGCQENLRSMELIKFTIEKLIPKVGEANLAEVIKDIQTAVSNHLALREATVDSEKERKKFEDQRDRALPKIQEINELLAKKPTKRSPLK